MASGGLHHWYHSLYVYNNPRRLQVQRIKKPGHEIFYRPSCPQ